MNKKKFDILREIIDCSYKTTKRRLKIYNVMNNTEYKIDDFLLTNDSNSLLFCFISPRSTNFSPDNLEKYYNTYNEIINLLLTFYDCSRIKFNLDINITQEPNVVLFFDEISKTPYAGKKLSSNSAEMILKAKEYLIKKIQTEINTETYIWNDYSLIKIIDHSLKKFLEKFDENSPSQINQS